MTQHANDLTPDTIRHARESRGLSRFDLAGLLLGFTPDELARAKLVHSTAKAIHAWELGSQAPSRANALRLQRILTPRDRG
jgi:DNA-binding transcriptional regulator YiaG